MLLQMFLEENIFLQHRIKTMSLDELLYVNNDIIV